MGNKGYVQDYPCKCGGGDMCYIVRHPDNEIDIGYPTREEAEAALEKLNDK